MKNNEGKTTWIESTQNQITKIIIGLMALGLIWLVQQAWVAKQADRANKIQWKRIRVMDKEHADEYAIQQYINGYTEARVECLEKGE